MSKLEHQLRECVSMLPASELRSTPVPLPLSDDKLNEVLINKLNKATQEKQHEHTYQQIP